MSGKIIFVNRYCFPDSSATSQILADLAFHLAETGWNVEIISSRQLYDDATAQLSALELIRDVQIRRVWTSTFGRSSMLGRTADYLSFYIGAAIAVLAAARGGDYVVSMTDPPLLSVVVGPLARLRGACAINWLQDLFPEVAQALGKRWLDFIARVFLRPLRNLSLRAASTNVVIGRRMALQLEAQGVARAAITEIPNWSIAETSELAHDQTLALRTEWDLDKAFVVGYSGNLGWAHEFDTLLGAADLLRDDPIVRFLFVGGGYRHAALRLAVETLGLGDAFRFVPHQPRALLNQSLCVPDVHWISLRPELEGLIVPSKFYGVLAAGRPVLNVGDPGGEVGSAVQQSECGFTLAVGDCAGLAKAIVTLKNDVELRTMMGENAQRLLVSDYDRGGALRLWEGVFAIGSS